MKMIRILLSIIVTFAAVFCVSALVAAEPLVVGVIARYDEHGAGIPLEKALEMDIDAIQIKAPFPENRTQSIADEILKKCRDKGIAITSMQSGFTGESYKTIPAVKETVGLVPKATRAERMEQFKSVCDFAKMLGLDTVCFHIGFVPHDPNDADFSDVVAMTRTLCDYAKANGQKIHLETGQEPGDVLVKFIEATGCDNLFVNFDPANLILYGCDEPIETLKKIAPYVKSVHCKDAKWATNRGAEWGTEVPFGEGDVNAKLFLQTLHDIGFNGALIIERENRGDPERQAKEALAGVKLVEKLKGEIWGK